MAPTGRKATPNHLKVLRGSRAEHLNPNEPVPGDDPALDLTRPPRGLGAKPSGVWRRLAPDLVAKRMLTPWDVDLFAAFCVSVAQYDEARRLVAKHGMTAPGSQDQLVLSPYLRAQAMALKAVLQVGARFGLTPADRASISLVADTVFNPTVRTAGVALGPERLLT